MNFLILCFRRSTYVFALIGISMIIYLFQYIDTENRKYASVASRASNTNRFYNSSVGGFLIKSKSRQHMRQRHIDGRYSEACEQLHKPLQSEILYQHTYWQVQRDGQEYVVVYSAFYDDRPIVGTRPYVRILGVRRISHKPLWCHVWYKGNNKPFIIEAEIVKIGRNYPFPGHYIYSQNMFSCPLDNVDSIPTHASITFQQCGLSSIFLPITTPRRSNEWSHNIGACLRVNSGYFPPEQIVEWMETYSMFGLTQVNIYNGSFDGKLDQVFEYYIRKGFVELRQMPPPVGVYGTKEVKLGSPASFNDCMLRNMYSHRFVVFVDFDEIIVPRIHNNYAEMLDHLDRLSHLPNTHHTYSFRNAYFFQHFPEDRSQPEFLRTMRLRYRANRPSAFLVRPKSFIDPRRCKSLFDQYCFDRSNKKDFLTMSVNMSIALSHHYRSGCPFSRFRCDQYDRKKIQDNIMLKFKDVLLRRVSTALKAIGVETVGL